MTPPGDPGDGDGPIALGTIQLHTFPSADTDFRLFARRALGDLPRPTPDALQRAIRERYPMAVVRAQQELARRGNGSGLVWYAFRHGLVGPSEEPADWDEPGLAWGVVDDDRRFVDVNEALAEIVELPREAIVGHAIEEFTNPDDPTAVDDIAELWRQFLRSGTAESTIRFNRMDGTERHLAYRIVANEAGEGRHRVRVREVEPDEDQRGAASRE